MRLICDCGNTFWHDDVSHKMINSKDLREYLGFKLKHKDEDKIEEQEVRYILCICGRRFYVVSDPQDVKREVLCFDEMLHRTGVDKEEQEWPEDYVAKQLQEALDYLKKENSELAAASLNELAGMLIEKAPYTAEQISSVIDEQR